MSSGVTVLRPRRRGAGRLLVLVAARLLSFLITVARDYLCVVGVEVVALAYCGRRDSNVFPFYVDATLVGHALLASAVGAAFLVFFRLMSGSLFDPFPQAPID